MLKTWDKTAWNYSVYPASAKSEGNTRELAASTKSRLHPFCPPKQIGRRGGRWHGWPSGKVTSLWHVSFGEMPWEIRGTGMRRTSNWRFTTNTKRVIQNKLNKSSERQSANLAAPFR